MKLAILAFTMVKSETSIHSNPYDISALLGKTGENWQLRTAKSSQENMGLLVIQSNSSYKSNQKLQGFKRLEIEPQNIFSYCENQRNTSNRPICFLTEPSLTKIHVLASKPINLCCRFPSALL